MNEEETVLEWLEKEFVKLESTVGVHHQMYVLIDKAKEMEEKNLERLKDFDTWKEWKNKPSY